MRTDRGVLGAPQLLKNVRHLLRGQRIVCLYRRVARHGGREPSDRVLDTRPAVQALQILGQRSYRGFAAVTGKDRREGGDPHDARPEFLYLKSQTLEIRRVGHQRLASTSRKLHQNRDQQALALQASRDQTLDNTFEKHAFMRYVL